MEPWNGRLSRGWRRSAALLPVVLVLACSSPTTPSAAPSGSNGPGQSAAASGSPGASSGSATPTPAPPTVAPTPATSYVAAISSVKLPGALTRAVAFATASTILICGGLTPNGTIATVLSLDPANGATAVGNLKHKVHDAAGGVVGGTMLVIGGGDATAGLWVQAVAADGSVTNTGVLPRARADLGAAAIGDTLYILGGGNSPLVDTQVLATTDGAHFSVVAKLLQGVRYPAIAVMNGKIYVIGGEVGKSETAAVQIVDVTTGVVSFGKPLAGPISQATALVIGGAIVVMGGQHDKKARTLMQRIDPADGSVTSVGNLPYAVADAAGVVLDGTGYLIGGEAKQKFLKTIITVDPAP